VRSRGGSRTSEGRSDLSPQLPQEAAVEPRLRKQERVRRMTLRRMPVGRPAGRAIPL